MNGIIFQMKTLITFLMLLTINAAATSLSAQEQQIVPYTLADRDRAIRTEVKMEALEIKMDTRFESVNARIDYLFWIMGVLVALILFNLGYTIWDRRTTLKPALDKADAADYISLSIARHYGIMQKIILI